MKDPLRSVKSKVRSVTKAPRLPKPPSAAKILADARKTVVRGFKPTAGSSRAGVRIKWRLAGFRELRLEPGVQNYIDQLAADIAARAGSGYEVSPWQGKNRARSSVYTATYDARYDNARNQTLLRALG